MKISYNWLKTLIPLIQSAEEISESLTMTGLEVEHIDEYNSVSGDLSNLIVGEILTINTHPNADKLQLTEVHIGDENILPIVCGAKNITVGQKVIIAPVGCTIYPKSHDPITIKKAKIRGEISEGMICAEDEIGLGESHDGIMVLPIDTPVGTMVDTLFQNNSDQILEIAILPNRGDAISHLGLARELKAITGIKYIKPSANSHDYRGKFDVKIDNQSQENCKRYTSVCLKNVNVTASPEWLQIRLKAIGLKPINNVVDISNYIQHHIGQPLHAFDYHKIEGGNIVVRNAYDGEKIILLDSTEVTLNKSHLVIADSKKPLALAGIMGGLDSGVSNETNTVVIESAYFNPVSVRKTSKKLGLQTDSSYRFERGTDIEMTELGLKMAVDMMLDICDAEIDSQIFDYYPTPYEPHKITLNLDKFQNFIGHEMSLDEITSILQSLEFKTNNITENTLVVEVPSFRTEIERPVDLYEEIIRIYGFDKIGIENSLSYTPSIIKKNDPENLEKKTAIYLSSIGFNEVMNNSLVPSKWYSDDQQESIINLMNPLSSDLNVLRPDLHHGIFENITYNINRKNQLTKFFEFGTVFSKKGKNFEEKRLLTIAICGDLNPEQWNATPKQGEVFHLKGIVSNLFKLLNISSEWLNKVTFDKTTDKELKMHQLKKNVSYATVPWFEIIEKVNLKIQIKDVPKFPIVRRDLSLVADKTLNFDEIKKASALNLKTILRDLVLFDVFEGKPLDDGKVSYSVAFYLYHPEKTLEDSEIDRIMNNLIRTFENDFGIIIRK
jgi:phenylalanyl-tRNA synthetase beta chain